MFGLRTHPGTRDSHRQLERRCAVEDAVHRAEDGDCLEAAEEPPELIPGRRRGKIHTHSPQKTTSKTTVLLTPPHLRREIVNISEEILTKYLTLEELITAHSLC